ncbi:apolipoprotein N-acyltransferase [uncultured Brevundimonas sp.]|uniref:apolipoprotein N-acyltransferase n=1 Tax=uncultured Brevundimonas sp. TaxID=213418 RepID=UPI00261D6150|nr:apolipoprotein N-acyltransferase [uncultured Brevundimonas sp.]
MARNPADLWDRGWIRILCALLAGVAAALAHPPFGILPGLLAYPALMILSERSRRLRGGFAMGWWFGFGYFLVGCWWVAEAFFVNPAQAWMAPIAVSALPAGIGLFTGIATLLYRWLKPQGAMRFVAFAVLFSALEWTRGHVLTGFPWNPVGASWQAGSAMSQMASVVGVYGLGLLTLVAVAAFGPLMTNWRQRSAQVSALVGAVLLALMFGYGTVRLNTVKVEPSPVMARIVQANVAQETKWSEDAYNDIVERYIALTSAPAERVPDVVIWPESALPNLANNVLAGPEAMRIAGALQSGQTLLAGLSRADPAPEGGFIYFNSLIELNSLGRDGMEVGGIYDKYRLVPFGEYLPLGELMGQLGIRSLVQMPEDLSGGPKPQPLVLRSLPAVQPLICYEGLFPGFTKASGPERPQWIVNVSNDAWFGQTSGPIQHLNLASYRAIETGLPMARATPTGVSAMIDPLGRIVEGSRISHGEARFVDVMVPAPLPETPFGRFGGFGYLAIIAILSLVVAIRYFRYRR